MSKQVSFVIGRTYNVSYHFFNLNLFVETVSRHTVTNIACKLRKVYSIKYLWPYK